MTKRLSALSALWTTLALCGGCAEPAGGIDLDTTPETTVGAFSEAGCATAQRDQFLENYTRGTTVVGMTPTTYSNANCFKAFMFDLGVIPGSILGSPTPAYEIAVDWTDPWPRNEAQCATVLGMQVYNDSQSWGPFTANGRWENGACNLGHILLSTVPGPLGSHGSWVGSVSVNGSGSFSVPNFGNQHVRLSVTARTAANNTQSVKVTYKLNPSPPPPACPGC